MGVYGMIRKSLSLFRSLVIRVLSSPYPLHFQLYKYILKKKHPKYPYKYTLERGIIIAKQCGYERVSVIELGVGGGFGLLQLERYAKYFSKKYSIDIDIYGFDIGETNDSCGLPELKDYRDIPYCWGEGFYKMDQDLLMSKKNSKTKLYLGDLEETVPKFLKSDYAPIAAVMVDLCFYSSIMKGLRIFKSNCIEKYIPRIPCYFNTITAGNEFVGDELAINDFNLNGDDIKICSPYYLRWQLHNKGNQIFEVHYFGHHDYAKRLISEKK